MWAPLLNPLDAQRRKEYHGTLILLSMLEVLSLKENFRRTAERHGTTQRDIEQLLHLTGLALRHLGDDFAQDVFRCATISLGASNPVDAARELLVQNGVPVTILHEENDEHAGVRGQQFKRVQPSRQPRAWR